MEPGRRFKRRAAKGLPSKSKRGSLKKDKGILAILRRRDALPILDSRSEDEIMGYGPNGLPGETCS